MKTRISGTSRSSWLSPRLRVSGYPATRCAALSEENRGKQTWLDPRSGHPDGRRTTLAGDELCREAAYLNPRLQRTPLGAPLSRKPLAFTGGSVRMDFSA